MSSMPLAINSQKEISKKRRRKKMSEIACFLWRHLSTTDVGEHLFPPVPPPPRLAPLLSQKEKLHLFLEEQSEWDETKRSNSNRCCFACPSPSELKDGSQALMQFIKITCPLQAAFCLPWFRKEYLHFFHPLFSSIVFYWHNNKYFIMIISIIVWGILKLTSYFPSLKTFIWPSKMSVDRNYWNFNTQFEVPE